MTAVLTDCRPTHGPITIDQAAHLYERMCRAKTDMGAPQARAVAEVMRAEGLRISVAS